MRRTGEDIQDQGGRKEYMGFELGFRLNSRHSGAGYDLGQALSLSEALFPHL